MKVENYHYSRFLISVHFERGFVPDTLQGKIEMCINFLSDLGGLARKSGKRLYATYSICSGNNGLHAHFAVSWLPMHNERPKTAQTARYVISRYTVIKLLTDNYFYVDNQLQAIKRVTHDRRFVTDYVVHQPKEGQSSIFTAFYIHADFVPTCSEIKMRSYCSKAQFGVYQNIPQNHAYNRLSLIVLISVAWFIMISAIILSIF